MKTFRPGLFVLTLFAIFFFSSCDKECECPAPTQQETVVLQPSNSTTESSVNSYYPAGNGVGVEQISAAAWTHGGGT